MCGTETCGGCAAVTISAFVAFRFHSVTVSARDGRDEHEQRRARDEQAKAADGLWSVSLLHLRSGDLRGATVAGAG